MEKDEGHDTMEALDAKKKLNLVDVNGPVQADAVKSEQEEVTNENVPSSSTTDNGLNRIEEKVIQETLKDGAGIFLHILPVPYLLVRCSDNMCDGGHIVEVFCSHVFPPQKKEFSEWSLMVC